jgi:iron complex outermembrane receptor protein
VFTVVILAALSVAALSQQNGQLAGSVTDQTGAALVGVIVTVRGAKTLMAETDAAGHFELRDLPTGDYELDAEQSGFAPAHRSVRVRPGDRLFVSLTLSITIVEQTVVTATKVGEGTVQTTPMAISALSNRELERLDVRTVDQAAALLPSVTFSQNTDYAMLTIRGIGTNAVNAGSDPSSAIYLDGVYLARPAMALLDFLDLDRIELLRGPQGTLYGRNAVGGALNLITKRPTNDFEASGRFTAGNLGQLRAEARVSGPLKRDRVMGSVAFLRGVQDGYVRDLNHPDHPLGGDDVTAARGQLDVAFDPRTDLLLSADVNLQRGTPLTFAKVLAVKPGFQVDNPPDPLEVRTSTPAWGRNLQYGATARLASALTPATTLVSLSAFRKVDDDFLVDTDVTELDLQTAHLHEIQHQVSEELTLSHQQAGLTWVGGMFLFHELEHQPVAVDMGGPRLENQVDPRVDATSSALFGQANVGLTSRLSLTAGLRYTHEGKGIDNAGQRYTLDPPQTLVSGSAYAYTDSITYTAWTPKLGLDMRLPNNTLVYFSATRGFKSGGFNPTSTKAGLGYAPEWAWSYEGGLKTELKGGQGRLNASAFVTDYTNLQVQTAIQPGVFAISNAATATIRGVEVEATARIGHGLEAGGHATWLDAIYNRYIAVGLGGITGDVAGNRLNNAPEWTGRLWIGWSGAISGSRRLSLAADSTAQSTVFFTPFNDNILRQRPYGLLGFRGEYGPNQRRWSINVFARNVTDTPYITMASNSPPPAYGGRPGPSRQLGMALTVRR